MNNMNSQMPGGMLGGPMPMGGMPQNFGMIGDQRSMGRFNNQ
jgi:hypothetical protein